MSQNHAATQHSQLTHRQIGTLPHYLSGHAGQCQTVIFRITGIGTRRNHYGRGRTSQHTCHVGVTKQ